MKVAEQKPPQQLDVPRPTWRACTHLTQPMGQRALATYHVDEGTGKFQLQLGEGFDLPWLSCHVSDIEDIYRISDGDLCFPPRILAGLTACERDTLFMLVLRHPASLEPMSICLLEASPCGLEDTLSLLGRLLRAHFKAPTSSARHDFVQFL